MTTPDSPALDPALVDACRDRLDLLRQEFEKRSIDGLIVSDETDIRYLTGFVGHDSLLIVFTDSAHIICDSRYDEFLEPWKDGAIAEVVIGIRHRLEEAARDLCAGAHGRRFGFQADRLTVSGRRRLTEILELERLTGTEGFVSRLRMRKDRLEIDRIVEAVGIQQEAIRATLAHLHPGMTELQFAARLEFEMKTRGAFKPGFDTIVGSGANASVIHHQTSQTPIDAGVLLVDWGALTPDGYCSDMTRTFSVGPMPPKIAEIYPIVLEAQLAAIEACRPGRTCAEIDSVARTIITDAGYGEQFGHGLGHGLGSTVHEDPVLQRPADGRDTSWSPAW